MKKDIDVHTCRTEGGRDKSGDWDWHIHTIIYEIDNE